MAKRIGLSALATLLLAGSVFAQEAATGMMERNARQQERIEQGMRAGTLNASEVRRLEGAQSRINRVESEALRDGKVTTKEQLRIQSMQDAASSQIYSEKHDAQTGNSEARSAQRNVNQQKRIEQGLRSGALTTEEAARLEREQAGIERLEAKAAKDGNITAEEKARIERAQNRVSGDIYREKHDAEKGDPNSASSRRMQHHVGRDVRQQQRIRDGVQSGELTNKEVGRLEGGQAHADRLEAVAGADGRVSARERDQIRQTKNRQSSRIHNEKHDDQQRH